MSGAGRKPWPGWPPRLSDGLQQQALAEALAAARAIGDEWRRAEALTGLAPRLPADLQQQALVEALAAARSIGEEGSRAEALVGLAPHLPADLLAEALAAAQELPEQEPFGIGNPRARALARLAPRLAALGRPTLYPLWADTLPILAGRTRKDLLLDLRALEPVIAALGGAEAVAETFRAIQDVGRWWP